MPTGDASKESAVVAGVRAGDAVAFRTLFQAHIDGLLAFARGYVRSAAVAEELVADVFLNIWVNRASFTVKESVAAYLYTAVRNRCLRSLDRERRARRWGREVLQGDRMPGVSVTPSSSDLRTVTSDIAEVTARVLAALPDRAREVFLLYRQHGLSYTEIGAVLGISARTVEGHMARAMTAFREGLSDFL